MIAGEASLPAGGMIRLRRTDLKVGDLLFWSHGSASSIYHVAMPERDYYGATRP